MFVNQNMNPSSPNAATKKFTTTKRQSSLVMVEDVRHPSPTSSVSDGLDDMGGSLSSSTSSPLLADENGGCQCCQDDQLEKDVKRQRFSSAWLMNGATNRKRGTWLCMITVTLGLLCCFFMESGTSVGPSYYVTPLASYVRSASSSATMHWAIAADSKAMKVAAPLLASVQTNSPRTFVYVIHLPGPDGEACHDLVHPRYSSMAACVEWKADEAAAARSLVKVVAGEQSAACAGLEGCDVQRARRLSTVLNFARFYLTDILPSHVQKVVWTDCDVILRKPLQPVWNQAFPQDSGSNEIMSSFVEQARFGRFYMHPQELSALMEMRFNTTLQLEGQSFNDGVIFLDLEQWRARKVKTGLTFLQAEHLRADPGHWKYGTQPMMMLLGAGYGWRPLDVSAYCGDLGFQQANQECLDQAVFLHFDGEKKPWLPNGLNKDLWNPFAVAAGVAETN